MKQHASLKFYMKVNVYDEENVQKGRLMLMNIAEDLKEYARIKVSPMPDPTVKPAAPAAAAKTDKASLSKKSTDLEDIKKQAD